MAQNKGIIQVAELAGVSPSTVSRVMNGTAVVSPELREKVEKAIAELGYSRNPIASNLKSSRKYEIAVVIPTLRRIYFTDIIKGISEYCYERGFLPVVVESEGSLEREKKLLEELERQWVDGIILLSCYRGESMEEYRSYLNSLAKLEKRGRNIPVVLVENGSEGVSLDQIYVDHEKCAREMTEHLLSLGRRRIGFIGNDSKAPNNDQWLKGIRGAMADKGLEAEERFIIPGSYMVLEGYEAMKQLLSQPERPDGLVCVNDQVASGAIFACREAGVEVPGDMAIVGYGGVALSVVTSPSITTMIAPRQEMGEQAAKLLLDRINGKTGEPVNIVLETKLAVRGSTKEDKRKSLAEMFGEA